MGEKTRDMVYGAAVNSDEPTLLPNTDRTLSASAATASKNESSPVGQSTSSSSSSSSSSSTTTTSNVNRRTFTIAEAAAKLGLPTETLVAWQELGLAPEEDTFSNDDVMQVRRYMQERDEFIRTVLAPMIANRDPFPEQ